MTATQLVALGLRLASIYGGWRLLQTIFDLFSAVQVLHRKPGTASTEPWIGEAIQNLSRYTHTPNEVSEAVYGPIGFSIFLWLFWTVLLWMACLPLARTITAGIDKAT